MSEQQLRLFPPPRPLVERLGVEFFRRAPAKPGIYIMSGEGERILYIGQSSNLRRRLSSYRHLRPERVSRRLTRLVHSVRAITWEVCDSPLLAQLRENELLRLHKPRFNTLNTRPENYAFIALRINEGGVQLRITRTPTALPGEQLYGAFKGLWRVRASCAALLRLLYAANHKVRMPFDLPIELLRCQPASVASLNLARRPGEGESPGTVERLRDFLEGVSDALIEEVSQTGETREDVTSAQRALELADLETLREFYRLGPARNRDLKQRLELQSDLIPQEDLDDLLVSALAGRGSPPDIHDGVAV